MKRNLVLTLSLVVGLGLSAWAQRSRDAVAIDPDVHHVVLENEHVRVFEAKAAPGRKSPMHTHPSLVLVSVGTARVKATFPDGKTSILDLRPGQVLWLENLEHSWELLSGDLHVVAVEVKSAARKAQAAK
jgi:quercetin dioxygenase-like cupin family protein